MSVVIGSPSLFDDLLFAPEYEHKTAEKWFRNNISLLFQALFLYLTFVAVARHYLRERKGFELRRPLAVWNFALAIFSAIGFYKMLPAFVASYLRHGIVATYSTFTEIQEGSCGYWMMLWRLSKIPEFVDTAFLVLRKREITFMHLFHHISTSVCVFFVHEQFSEYNGLINYFIHAIMYTYFSLSALGFSMSPKFAQFITTVQLIQFIVSEFIYLHVAYLSLTNPTITMNWLPFMITICTISSQLMFWIEFMRVEYFRNGGRKYSKVVKKSE
ncbi:Elongation of very long chain fatty acids protein [Aphelenchoides besseyi]|nr:Elongation of very long chain fatty acids protein [Aphelenchoides besseyi]